MEREKPYSIVDGFQASQKGTAIGLFWQAFKGKLHPVMKPKLKALRFLDMVADPAHAISAISRDGTLIGVAGFKTTKGSFIGGSLKQLCAVYGLLGGCWRGLVLSVLERPLQADTLLMDGIFVSETARGGGVGSALLSAIKEKAIACGCSKVRLDVIDTNPRARVLYERHGFISQDTSDIGPLRHIFGFQKATAMVCEV